MRLAQVGPFRIIKPATGLYRQKDEGPKASALPLHPTGLSQAARPNGLESRRSS
jgi:hypothetical protein